MRKTKTLLSVLLTLALLLSLGASALAADPGTIKVADPGSYVYRAYKIFDAVENDNNTPADQTDDTIDYTIKNTSPWFNVVYDTSTNTSKVADLKFELVTGSTDTYSVTAIPGFSSAALADYLKSALATTTPQITDFTQFISDESGTHTPLTSGVGTMLAGYYLVVSSADSFSSLQPNAALTTVLDGRTVVIQNKNDMPFDKTVNDEKIEGVQIGEVLNFKIVGKVPIVPGNYTFYAYQVKDTMDPGLTFNDDLVVTIKNGNTIVETINPTVVSVAGSALSGDEVRYGQNGKTFELSLDMLTRGQNLSLQGKTVEITYTATVNENAVIKVTENNAVLEYGNDPLNLIVKDSQTKVYDAQILIDKFENGAPEQKLQGAKFILIKYADHPSGDAVQKGTSGTTPYYFHASYTGSALDSIDWVANQNGATQRETDINGATKFRGLDDGYYYVKEVQAPVGYTLLADELEVYIDGSNSITPGIGVNQAAMILTHTASVANTPGTTLPSTGGIGTTIFYLAGSVLIVGALLVLMLRKRANEG